MIKYGTFLYVIYIDANHVMIGPPNLQHYITIVWNILYMFSSLNLMPTVKKRPFHAFFRTGIDDLVTGSDDFRSRLGFFWWQKHFLEKKKSSNAFSVPEGIIGVFVASMEYFTNVFKYPYFTFMVYA